MKFENINNTFNKRKENSKIESLLDSNVLSEKEEITLSQIVPFTDKNGKAQPFTLDSEDIQVLADSIKEYGLLTPVTVRDLGNGKYQLLSGHKRYAACELLGKQSIDCKIIDCDDETAYFVVCNANVQRKAPKPSELNKMFHYYCDTFGDDKSVTELSKMFGVSAKTLYRCLHLDELIPDIVSMVDSGSVSTMAIEIIDVLNNAQQKVLVKYIIASEKELTPATAKKIVALADENPKFKVEDIEEYLKPKKKENAKYKSGIYNRIYNSSPELLSGMNEDELDNLIIKLLEEHHAKDVGEVS